MGIISINEKRTVALPHVTTGRARSFHTADRFKEPASYITENLAAHYDFGDTECWTGVVNSTSSTDYTVHNLASDYNDAIFREKSNGTTYINSTGSPVWSKSTDGGGCLETDPGQLTDDRRGFVLVPGAASSSTASATTYWTAGSASNFTIMPANDSNNIFNGVGTGAFTLEAWYKIYSSSGAGWNRPYYLNIRNTSANNRIIQPIARGWGYTAVAAHTNATRYHSSTDDEYIYTDNPGAPTSGADWTHWIHSVYTRSSTATNGVKVYVNTSLEATSTHTENIDYFRFGMVPYNQFVTNLLKMRLAIFRFYKGKALTSSEVTQNWNAEKTRFGH